MSKRDLEQRREGLSPAMRAELQRRLRGGAPAAAPSARIPRQLPGELVLLSTSQERLWLIDQLFPGTPAYNIPVAARIRGALDTSALKRGLDALVERHHALRTVFDVTPEGCRQRVLPTLAVALPIVDLRQLGEDERDAERERHLRAMGEHRFDLARGPLLHACLLWLAPREHLLLLTFHHIVCDGVSSAIALRELTALYEAFAAGRSSPLPELPIQYVDYAAWQREQERGHAHARQLEQWSERLAGAPTWLELPTDHPRAATSTQRSSTETILIPREVFNGLTAVGRAERATPFMVLLAALQAVLTQHAGQRDLLVAAPISNRPRAELEPLIGFFVNTLPLRARVTSDDTFRGLLGRVRDGALAAYAGSEVPFERIIERLGVRPERGRVPFSEVMFSFEEVVPIRLGGAGMEVDLLELDAGWVHLDVVVRAREVAAGLRVTATYKRDLFEAASMQRLLDHYARLLGAVAGSPDALLSDAPLLGPDERRRVLHGWACPSPIAIDPRCVHELFEEHARRAPDAEAVLFEGRALTYAELDARANQLAHALQARGASPEQVVAVALQRSERLVVTLLAIFKAGAAYLPLDPADPPERLARVLADSGAILLVTDAASASAFDGDATPRLDLDREETRIRQAAPDRPTPSARPDSLAYVLYTSGSTADPRGVLVEHRNLANQVQWRARAIALGPADRLLQCIPHTFDPSLWGLVGPLAAGASLVITAPGGHRNAGHLRDLSSQHGVTILDFSLPMLQAFLEAPGIEELTRVRHVFCGGEAMPPDVPRRLHQRLPARLFNQYGPTETTIDATFWACRPDVTETIPIGHPIDNARVYVLDERLAALPIGAVGEICIGGAGVARGYLGDPRRTQEKFVTDPHVAGGRLYRTGDLGRFRNDGAIEFLGRRDHQVKIRGVRIELGEVEGKLCGHPGVREAVVVARTDGPDGSARLVAYAVAHPATDLSTRDLRLFLRSKLPEIMVPSAFVVLPGLPLNGNGKVDRKALPPPDVDRPELDAEYVEPRTPSEHLVASAMKDCLGLGRVGALDDFFQLGGHSLLAMRIAARLSGALGVTVPVRLLFENLVVQDFARALETLGPDRDAAHRITARAPDAPAPISFQQRFLWELARRPDAPAHCNVPLAVRLTGTLDASALAWAVEQLLARHAALRTTFQVEHGEITQRAVPPTPFALTTVDLTAAPPAAREALLRELAVREAQAPFDLGRDPLLRGPLVRLGAEDHALLLTTHRIAYDGWSLGVIQRELVAFYLARTRGVAVDLPALQVQYSDYAAWQPERFSQETLDAQVAHRLAHLADEGDAEPAPRAPSSAPTPGARCSRALPSLLVDRLASFAVREGVTRFMVVLTAVHLALAATGHPLDERICVPMANRAQREVEPLVGRFVNMLALRPRLREDDSVRAALARVRETMLQAYAHQDLPFELLARACAARGVALPRILFNLVDAPTGSVQLPGLAVEPLPVLEPTAEFDLAIYAHALGAQLELSSVAAADILAPAAADALLARIERALHAMIDDPDRPLSRLQTSIQPPAPGLLGQPHAGQNRPVSTPEIEKIRP
jgi:amino acid adenylation domain-containing protein